MSSRFAGIPGSGTFSKSYGRKIVPELFLRQGQGNFTRSYIAGFLDDGLDIHHSQIVMIPDPEFSQLEISRIGIDPCIRLDHPQFQSHRHSQWFHGRARFEYIRNRTIAQTSATRTAITIGVETGLIDHGQHFTGFYIQYHDGTRYGIVLCDGRLEFAVGDVLQSLIQTQRQVFPRLRHTQALDVRHHLTTSITQHAFQTRLTRQLFVEGKFQPLLTHIIQVGEPDEVGKNLTIRVITPVFTGRLQPDNMLIFRHIHHRLSRFRRQTSFQVDKVLVAVARQSTPQVIQTDVQRLGQRLKRVCIRTQQTRIRRNGIHRRAHGQHRAIAIGDGTSMRGYLHPVQIAMIALGL